MNVIGTGGISSTAEDMVRFSQLFMGQGKGILSDKVVKAMEQEEYKKECGGGWREYFNYGLGWDSVKLYPFSEYGIKALAKGGDTALQHAILVVLPEQKIAAAVLTSGGRSSTNQLMATELLLATLKEKGIKEIKPNKSFGKPVKVKMPQGVARKLDFMVIAKLISRLKLRRTVNYSYHLIQKKICILLMEALLMRVLPSSTL